MPTTDTTKNEDGLTPKEVFVSEGSVKDRMAMWGGKKSNPTTSSKPMTTRPSYTTSTTTSSSSGGVPATTTVATPHHAGFRKSAVVVYPPPQQSSSSSSSSSVPAEPAPPPPPPTPTTTAIPSASSSTSSANSRQSMPAGSHHSLGSKSGSLHDRLKAWDRATFTSSSSSKLINTTGDESTALEEDAAPAPVPKTTTTTTAATKKGSAVTSRYAPAAATMTLPPKTAVPPAPAGARSSWATKRGTATTAKVPVATETTTAPAVPVNRYSTGLSVKDRLRSWGGKKPVVDEEATPTAASIISTASTADEEERLSSVSPQSTANTAVPPITTTPSTDSDSTAAAAAAAAAAAVALPPKKRWQPSAYTNLSLKKVAPPVEDGHKRYQTNASPLPSVALRKQHQRPVTPTATVTTAEIAVVPPPPAATTLQKKEETVVHDDIDDEQSVQSFQTSLYSVASLKRVERPRTTRPNTTAAPATDTEPQTSTSSIYKSMPLKRVEPPKEDKWKLNKSSHDSTEKEDDNAAAASPYKAVALKSVAPPLEDKWKHDKTSQHNDENDDVDEAPPSTQQQQPLYARSAGSLRSVVPPKEDKWRTLKTVNTHMSSTDNAQLAPAVLDDQVGAPAPMLAASSTAPVEPEPEPEPEFTLEELQAATTVTSTTTTTTGSRQSSGRPSLEDLVREKVGVSSAGGNPKKLLMLISTMSGRQDQKAAQDRAVTILKGMKIASGSELFEQLDGADPANRARRNELFAISGLRAKYPQFFLVDGDRTEFLADWESFEYMHDSGSLHDSMNLDAASEELLLASSSHHSKMEPEPTTMKATKTTTTTSMTSVQAQERSTTRTTEDAIVTSHEQKFSIVKTRHQEVIETEEVETPLPTPSDVTKQEQQLDVVEANTVEETAAAVEDHEIAVMEPPEPSIDNEAEVEQSPTDEMDEMDTELLESSDLNDVEVNDMSDGGDDPTDDQVEASLEEAVATIEKEDGTPRHLRNVHQPSRERSFDAISIDEDELFEVVSDNSPPKKPLLAAALKAKAEQGVLEEDPEPAAGEALEETIAPAAVETNELEEEKDAEVVEPAAATEFAEDGAASQDITENVDTDREKAAIVEAPKETIASPAADYSLVKEEIEGEAAGPAASTEPAGAGSANQVEIVVNETMAEDAPGAAEEIDDQMLADLSVVLSPPSLGDEGEPLQEAEQDAGPEEAPKKVPDGDSNPEAAQTTIEDETGSPINGVPEESREVEPEPVQDAEAEDDAEPNVSSTPAETIPSTTEANEEDSSECTSANAEAALGDRIQERDDHAVETTPADDVVDEAIENTPHKSPLEEVDVDVESSDVADGPISNEDDDAANAPVVSPVHEPTPEAAVHKDHESPEHGDGDAAGTEETLDESAPSNAEPTVDESVSEPPQSEDVSDEAPRADDVNDATHEGSHAITPPDDDSKKLTEDFSASSMEDAVVSQEGEDKSRRDEYKEVAVAQHEEASTEVTTEIVPSDEPSNLTLIVREDAESEIPIAKDAERAILPPEESEVPAITEPDQTVDETPQSEPAAGIDETTKGGTSHDEPSEKAPNAPSDHSLTEVSPMIEDASSSPMESKIGTVKESLEATENVVDTKTATAPPESEASAESPTDKDIEQQTENFDNPDDTGNSALERNQEEDKEKDPDIDLSPSSEADDSSPTTLGQQTLEEADPSKQVEEEEEKATEGSAVETPVTHDNDTSKAREGNPSMASNQIHGYSVDAFDDGDDGSGKESENDGFGDLRGDLHPRKGSFRHQKQDRMLDEHFEKNHSVVSDSGWSDSVGASTNTDEASVMTFGTLGSAVIVDATVSGQNQLQQRIEQQQPYSASSDDYTCTKPRSEPRLSMEEPPASPKVVKPKSESALLLGASKKKKKIKKEKSNSLKKKKNSKKHQQDANGSFDTDDSHLTSSMDEQQQQQLQELRAPDTPSKKKKKKKRDSHAPTTTATTSSEDYDLVLVDTPSKTKKKKRMSVGKANAKMVDKAYLDDDFDDSATDAATKLSKEERKRLKKLKKKAGAANSTSRDDEDEE